MPSAQKVFFPFLEREFPHLVERYRELYARSAYLGRDYKDVLAARLYGPTRGLATEEAWERRFPAVHRVLANKYYIDELYDRTVIGGTWGLARALFRFDAGFIDGLLVNGARNVTVTVAMISGFFDKYVVDGLVNLVATILDAFSKLFRRLQTGYVSNYALVLAAGMFALVVVYMVLHRG